mmetsp:Transcript_27432/g.20579  ORF Transcript_27432/g.20579 Transcript_27432/m.20579 type:complete len:123 (-) Transcript_27432:77-445(-)
MGTKKGYKVVKRGEGDEEEKGVEREMEEYVRIIEKKTEFFSTFDVEDIFQSLVELGESQCLSFDISKTKYKIKLLFLVGEGKKAENVTLAVNLLRVNEGKVCIDISRSEGDIFTFFKQLELI